MLVSTHSSWHKCVHLSHGVFIAISPTHTLVGRRAHAARIDDMGTRIDDLEKALNDLMAQVC